MRISHKLYKFRETFYNEQTTNATEQLMQTEFAKRVTIIEHHHLRFNASF